MSETPEEDIVLKIGQVLRQIETHHFSWRHWLVSLWRTIKLRLKLHCLFIELDRLLPTSIEKQAKQLKSTSLKTLALAAKHLPIRRFDEPAYLRAARERTLDGK